MISSRHLYKRCFSTVTLGRDTNQAYGLAKYAINFLKNGKPSLQVNNRVKSFHKDALFCGVASLSAKANTPSIFRNEAYKGGKSGYKGAPVKPKMGFARVIGSNDSMHVEKAVAANVSAIAELDASSFMLGRSKESTFKFVEAANCVFYPVALAAAQQGTSLDGGHIHKTIVLLSEVHGRLCESFPLQSLGIHPSLHGAIASAVAYGALSGATAKQIEYAIGIINTHFIPRLTTRNSETLNDSIGGTYAFAAESAITAVNKAMSGFVGPTDIFRSPYSIFKTAEATAEKSAFDITLGTEGNDFAIMNCHFRYGSYEMHAASAIEGVLKLLHQNPSILDLESIESIKVITYKDGLDVIAENGNTPPLNRHSALQSAAFLIASILNKAAKNPNINHITTLGVEGMWSQLMLLPPDYTPEALKDPVTVKLMQKITCEHGGKEYDDKFPEGFPTTVRIKIAGGKELDSEMILYPHGHAKNNLNDLDKLVNLKGQRIAEVDPDNVNFTKIIERLDNLEELGNSEIQGLYNFPITYKDIGLDNY